jgi:hypothetical protein
LPPVKDQSQEQELMLAHLLYQYHHQLDGLLTQQLKSSIQSGRQLLLSQIKNIKYKEQE